MSRASDIRAIERSIKLAAANGNRDARDLLPKVKTNEAKRASK